MARNSKLKVKGVLASTDFAHAEQVLGDSIRDGPISKSILRRLHQDPCWLILSSDLYVHSLSRVRGFANIVNGPRARPPWILYVRMKADQVISSWLH